MKNILIGVGLIIAGFFLGVAEENIRYSIIHNEARKGDKESQAIVDELGDFGARIEGMLK